jgi:hypothetical protein
MPPDIRQAYQRALATIGDGKLTAVPNASGAERLRKADVSAVEIAFNGQEYASVAEMPAEVRRLYDGVMNAIDTNRNGIPDVLEDERHTTGHAQLQGGETTQTMSIAAPDSNVIRSESTSLRLMVAIAVIAALLFASYVLGH